MFKVIMNQNSCKKLWSLFSVLLLAAAQPLMLRSALASTPHAAKIFRVMIDPGHGGSDEGTVFRRNGFKIAEKTITLQLATEIGKQLRARGFFVTLTRRGDQEVSLPSRTAMANRWGADAFISIHTNSKNNIYSRDAEGVETYILNNATDASSRRLARMENSVFAQEETQVPQSKEVALILKDLRLDANLAASKKLACSVQTQVVAATSGNMEVAQRRNRGVKQALFHVLLGADMPSILVEAGFLSNARDRSWLLNAKGRQMIGRAVANALDRFRSATQTNTRVAALDRCKVSASP